MCVRQRKRKRESDIGGKLQINKDVFCETYKKVQNEEECLIVFIFLEINYCFFLTSERESVWLCKREREKVKSKKNLGKRRPRFSPRAEI